MFNQTFNISYAYTGVFAKCFILLFLINLSYKLSYYLFFNLLQQLIFLRDETTYTLFFLLLNLLNINFFFSSSTWALWASSWLFMNSWMSWSLAEITFCYNYANLPPVLVVLVIIVEAEGLLTVRVVLFWPKFLTGDVIPNEFTFENGTYGL